MDTHTVTTSCGLNGAKVARSDAYNPGTGLGSFDCFFADGPATTNVTATVEDSDGAADTDNQVVVVTVNNVAPSVVVSGTFTDVAEGTTRTYTYTVSDPGDDPNPLITESCGSGATYLADAAANSFQCKFLDGPGSSTVNVTADDGDPTNNIGQDPHTVTILNVAPTIAISGAASVNEGSSYSLTLGAVTDPGTDTVTSYIVHWGDGSSDTYSTAGDKTHTYADGPNDYDDHRRPGRRGRHLPRPRQRLR